MSADDGIPSCRGERILTQEGRMNPSAWAFYRPVYPGYQSLR